MHKFMPAIYGYTYINGDSYIEFTIWHRAPQMQLAMREYIVVSDISWDDVMEHCLILKKIYIFIKDSGLKHRKTHAFKKNQCVYIYLCIILTSYGTCHRLTISLSIISHRNTTPIA